MNALRRIIPYPLLFLALLAMWMLLQQSLSPGQFILGTIVALGGCWAMVAMRPEPTRIRRISAALRLAGRVFVDVFRSNRAVGTIILGASHRRTHAGFMTLRLDLTNRYGLAVLAIVMTCTPGTLWVHYDPVKRTLLLHVLDLVNESDWVRLIKLRYEILLLEIFE
ncbi:Na+/H+ antiporter subunit E [Ancylobacter pratisalsi]|uniref:Na+/H+ antiporter subunit E n=1 Tax=Ancylobacter pratisalsi TaxID=1745854 RepID=A0A6P1YIC2_9HYPH|nr:Na+/H+ antiporter subunit E [Ancylobacter pratisalsi]QIB32720.1 Na+/H+ antiporter subunit E [Ancylobacter pratisalsi]